MPRQLCVEYSGAIYHVMSGGDRRENIFHDEVDRQFRMRNQNPCGRLLASLRDASAFKHGDRWYRRDAPRPPATGFEPSGFQQCRVHDLNVMKSKEAIRAKGQLSVMPLKFGTFLLGFPEGCRLVAGGLREALSATPG